MNQRMQAQRDAATAVLAQWDEWSQRCTDALFDLDARVGTAGSDDDKLDVAAAFLARKAIVERIEQLRAAAPGADLAGMSARPLVDEQGGAVANDLATGAQLVDAIVAKVTKRLDAADAGRAAADQARLDAVSALAECDRLAEALSSDASRLAALHARFDAAGADGAALTSVAAELEALRRDLRAADAERQRLLTELDGAPAALDALRAREAEVRGVVSIAREKISGLPNLAIPSVDALEGIDRDATLALPWPAAKPKVLGYVDKVRRLGAAFDEVERRFGGPLARRDELRGLVQAYREKAGAHRKAEDPDLDRRYRAAADLLWSAPCDVTTAERLVDEYAKAVNALVGARPGTWPAGTTGVPSGAIADADAPIVRPEGAA